MMGKSGGGRPAFAPACRDPQRAVPLAPAALRILRTASASLPSSLAASFTASFTAATDAVIAAARRRSRPYAAPPFLDVSRSRGGTARRRRERDCP